jgi:hypothetical protein
LQVSLNFLYWIKLIAKGRVGIMEKDPKGFPKPLRSLKNRILLWGNPYERRMEY